MVEKKEKEHRENKDYTKERRDKSDRPSVIDTQPPPKDKPASSSNGESRK